ncbi:sporulation protein [Actinotalea ferrariae CF5-4]|uniref:Sporulation protein n=1 Tax=Actinotalea ferrariae CF5-4 TaxID=948458 RepID=A0A021VWQ0_9CELL|nr:spore germination protein GerW family protein [Actinotalea ferrariae]EYR63492.1 sporulation protein [Actinotalea ferrariae CF5-4]
MEPFQPGRAVADLLTVRRVFGERVTRDGVTVIPVARVMGGGGGGSAGGPGPDESAPDQAAPDPAAPDQAALATGGGLGVQVTPLGVYVVSGSQVTWQPALDLQRIITGGMALGGLAILTVLVGLRRRPR